MISTTEWLVQRLSDGQAEGYACAVLFAPFRRRQVVTDAFNIPPQSRINVELKIPDDWPEGLSQVVMAIAADGAMSFLGFDTIVVQIKQHLT